MTCEGVRITFTQRRSTLSLFHLFSADSPTFSEFPNTTFPFPLEFEAALLYNWFHCAPAKPTNHELSLQVPAAVSDSRCELGLRGNKSLQLSQLMEVGWRREGDVTIRLHPFKPNGESSSAPWCMMLRKETKKLPDLSGLHHWPLSVTAFFFFLFFLQDVFLIGTTSSSPGVSGCDVVKGPLHLPGLERCPARWWLPPVEISWNSVFPNMFNVHQGAVLNCKQRAKWVTTIIVWEFLMFAPEYKGHFLN